MCSYVDLYAECNTPYGSQRQSSLAFRVVRSFETIWLHHQLQLVGPFYVPFGGPFCVLPPFWKWLLLLMLLLLFLFGQHNMQWLLCFALFRCARTDANNCCCCCCCSLLLLHVVCECVCLLMRVSVLATFTTFYCWPHSRIALKLQFRRTKFTSSARGGGVLWVSLHTHVKINAAWLLAFRAVKQWASEGRVFVLGGQRYFSVAHARLTNHDFSASSCFAASYWQFFIYYFFDFHCFLK